MALSYQTGYRNFYKGPLSKKDIDTDVFKPFKDYQKTLEEAKIKAEADREKRLAMHKEMRGQIEDVSTTNMYDGHYKLLRDAASVLASQSTIDKYASTPEGQSQYEGMVQQLNDAIDYYENYYKSTYGSSKDDPTLSTWNAAYMRSLTPEVNTFQGAGYEATRGWDQINGAYEGLQGQQHRQGSVRVENGQLMFDGLDGKSMGIMETPLDMKIFDPGLQVMDMSGYTYFMQKDDGRFQTEQAVRDYIANSINENDVNLTHSLRHYINTNDIQRGYEDLLSDEAWMGQKMDEIVKLWQDEAVDAWRGRRAKDKPTATDVTRYEAEKEKRRRVEAALGSVNLAGYNPETPDEFASGARPGELWFELTDQEPGTVDLVPMAMTFPLPLGEEIEVPKEDGTLVSLKVGKFVIDNIADRIVLEGTTTKTTTELGAVSNAITIPVDISDAQTISDLDRQLRQQYGYSLKELLSGITGVDGIQYEGRRGGVREVTPDSTTASAPTSSGAADNL